jgi:hypothetical protein
MRHLAVALALVALVRAAPDEKNASRKTTLTDESRLAFIRKAQVWTKTDIPNMNLRIGPGGHGAFEPNQAVVCDYVETRMHGSMPKFHCAISKGDVVKVRYGAHIGEVEGSVLATRLLWALGFTADRVYPVHVTCRGCASDPWHRRERVSGQHVFDPAVIERKPPGTELHDGDRKAGWAWQELDLVDESQGGAPVEQRDALKLLAVFMQHTDTRSPQQRLLCVGGGLSDTGGCQQPFMFLHDVGKTFGHANVFNRERPGSVNFDGWAQTPVWKDPARCIGHLSRSFTGTLGDPHISEAGRSFLAGLLVQLTDQQLRDLFEVAGVERRSASSGSSHSLATIDDWVAAFSRKRNEIVAAHCPA